LAYTKVQNSCADIIFRRRWSQQKQANAEIGTTFRVVCCCTLKYLPSFLWRNGNFFSLL